MLIMAALSWLEIKKPLRSACLRLRLYKINPYGQASSRRFFKGKFPGVEFTDTGTEGKTDAKMQMFPVPAEIPSIKEFTEPHPLVLRYARAMIDQGQAPIFQNEFKAT